MTNASDEWTTWLARHGPVLMLLVRPWVASRADAEDVVQDAFVRFWGARHRAVDPAAYLYTCAKHCALDRQRGQRRQVRREQAVARPEAETLFASSLEQDERRAAIEAALGDLPENQREVLVMKIWGGLSFPQIATALGISGSTAASRYRYALDKLRAVLAKESIP